MKTIGIILSVLLLTSHCYAGLLTTKVPTHQERLTAYVENLVNFIRVSEDRREADQKTAYDRTWNSSEFTPQEIITELGVNASELFIKSVLNEQCIKQINPSWQMMSAPYNVTLNQDGTVTVGECIHESCMPKSEPVLAEPTDNNEPAL